MSSDIIKKFVLELIFYTQKIGRNPLNYKKYSSACEFGAFTETEPNESQRSRSKPKEVEHNRTQPNFWNINRTFGFLKYLNKTYFERA